MKLYLSSIGFFMVLIGAVNILVGTQSVLYVLVAVVWCTALQFALDGAIAISVRLLPDRLFGIGNPIFRVFGWERRLYKILGVRRWRDKIWELGGLGGFSKAKIDRPRDPEYLEKYIIECNRGVATHTLSYGVGFLAMLTLDGVTAFTVALPVAVVNLFLNILPTIVLRFNTPLLKAMLERLQKHS